MLMKKLAVTFVALAAAVSAHAQLSIPSETTTGTSLVTTATDFDVSFGLASPAFSGIFVGSGGLGFTLLNAADVTFSGATTTNSSFGMLSGSSLPHQLDFYFNSGLGSDTVLLSPGAYTYSAGGIAFGTTANLLVDVHAVSAVPEPQTYGMLLAGLAVIGVSVRRRRMPVVSRSLALSC